MMHKHLAESPMKRNERGGLGEDKVAKFGWIIKDQPGTLQWLPKDVLVVDHSYQRPASNRRALSLASSWSWIAAGVIVVARRKDSGRFYVVDGQHRVLAALKRSDIEMLPCLIFESDGPEDEAAGFYDANANRRMPTSLEKWRSQLMRRDPVALFVHGLIKQIGREIGDSNKSLDVRCLTALLQAAHEHRDELTRLWPLIASVCMGRPIHNRLVRGLIWVERNIASGSLVEKRWADRVAKVGYDALLDGAHKACAYYTEGGERIWGLGMLEAINAGLRNRLVVHKGDDA